MKITIGIITKHGPQYSVSTFQSAGVATDLEDVNWIESMTLNISLKQTKEKKCWS